ncbi:hypothetical protein [Enterobacter sp. ECC-175]
MFDQKLIKVLDRHYLINSDGNHSVRMITRLPIGMIKISAAEDNLSVLY